VGAALLGLDQIGAPAAAAAQLRASYQTDPAGSAPPATSSREPG
jgi:hypothetical protein